MVFLTSESTIKGSILAATLEFLEQELTPQQREEVFARVDPKRERTGARKVLATERIPLSFVNELTVVAAQVKGEPLSSFARRSGRFAADFGMKGVYRFLVRALQPGFALSKATSVFSTVNERGRLEATRDGDKAAIVKLLDLKAELAMCERIHGWLERLNQMTGVKNTVVEQTKCCSRGADHCEWIVRWS